MNSFTNARSNWKMKKLLPFPKIKKYTLKQHWECILLMATFISWWSRTFCHYWPIYPISQSIF